MQDSQTMAHFLCGTGWSHVGALSFLKENMFAPPGDFSIFKQKHVSEPLTNHFLNENTLVSRSLIIF